MSLRIDVEGGTLDLLPNAAEEFYITKQVHDLHDLETREGDFTKTIVAPYTGNNFNLLGDNTPSFTRHSSRGTRFIPCQLILKGVSVMDAPVLRIESGNNEGFSITIFSGSVGFFLRLSDDPIADLDWSDLDFIWSRANVASRRANTAGIVTAHSAWIDNVSFRTYQVERGNATQDRLAGMSVPNMGFWTYFKEIFDRIMLSDSMEGLTLDYGDLQNDPNFLTLAAASPMNALRSFYKTPSAGFSGVHQVTQVNNLPGGYSEKLALTATTSDNITLINNEWVVTIAGNTSVDSFTFCSGVITGLPVTISIMRNDEILAFQTVTGSAGGAASIRLNVNSHLSLNDRIWFRITLGGVSTQTAVGAVTGSGGVNQLGGEATEIAIRVNEYLPEISQIAFVKSVLAMFNMVVTEKNNIVKISSWDKIPGTAPIEIDLDISRNITESGIFEGYARRNLLKYGASEEIERTDLDGEIIVDVAGVDETLTKIELPFYGADVSEIPNLIPSEIRAVIPGYSILRFNVTDNTISLNTIGNTYTTGEKNALKVGDVINAGLGAVYGRVSFVESNVTGRLDFVAATLPFLTWSYLRYSENSTPLQISAIEDTTGDYTLTDGQVTETFQGNFKRAVFAPELTFSFLIDNYFKNLASSLLSPFTLTAWFHIDILKFIEIDQLRPFYLASYGANFYVNLIEQYKADGLVRIELLQVGASTQIVADAQGLQVGAFDDSFSNAFDNYDQNEI